MDEHRRRSDKAIDELSAKVELIRKDVTDILISVRLNTNQITANHKSLRSSIDEISAKQKEHNDTIFGNGQKGLTAYRDEIEKIDEKIDAHTKWDMMLYGTILIPVLAIVWKVFFG